MADRRTPFYDYHLRHAGQLIKGGGDYWFPDAYTSPGQEHTNTRTNIGMQDISSMGEIDVKGPGAERLINRLVVNDILALEPGQIRYTSMCNEHGGIVDDLTVYKFNDEHFMIVTSSAPRKAALRWIAEHATTASAYVSDISAAVALVVVQGRARVNSSAASHRGSISPACPFSALPQPRSTTLVCCCHAAATPASLDTSCTSPLRRPADCGRLCSRRARSSA